MGRGKLLVLQFTDTDWSNKEIAVGKLWRLPAKDGPIAGDGLCLPRPNDRFAASDSGLAVDICGLDPF